MMRPAYSRAAQGLVVTSALALGACTDHAPTAPEALLADEAPRTELTVLSSAPLTLGWLAPLGSASSGAPHDVELRPVVTVCRWKDEQCAGNPVAQFSIGSGLTASSASFGAEWQIAAPPVPAARTTYRISVTVNGAQVGTVVFVDVARGRWALTVPGAEPTLIAATSIPLQFRVGVQSVPPPPITTVISGLESASTQFLPGPTDEPRTIEQTESLVTLSSSLSTLQSALAGETEDALLALSEARRAADRAFSVAVPGDKADLDVVRLELFQVGLSLGSSG